MGLVRARRNPLIVAVEFAVKMPGPDTVNEVEPNAATLKVPLYGDEFCIIVTFAVEFPVVTTSVGV